MFLLFTKKRRPAPKRSARKASPPETLSLPEHGLSFTFQRDRCRTLRLTVKPDGSLLVKAPAAVPLDAVLDFVRSRRAWIRAKQDFFLSHRGEGPQFHDGGTVFFLGRAFTLRTVPPRRGAKPRLMGGREDGHGGPFLELPCKDGTPEAVEAAVKAWRLALAKQVLARRLARLDELARLRLDDGARPAGLTVRSLKRRWGSCTVRGQITLAAQLIELPLPLMDYVICHELCHLRRMDHSPAFRTALRRLLPDARERERRIRLWSLEHPRV
ncbi:M48 family metallopeptidase [Mailhella sp.]|uniref:M48 family metallopeptidase n=1 Tax=Mailhella sp. TaxID=1981029 RepID=UPI00406405AB